MSKHKFTDMICIVVTVLSLLITIIFMNGEALGIQAIVDEDAETYTGDTVFTDNDLNGAWDTSDACRISLEGDGGTVQGNGAYFLDGNLVISSAGCYVISGSLDDGYIQVNANDSSKIWIMLDGADIYCSDNACIRIDQADKVFLTLAEGSENSLKSGEKYSEEALADGTGGTIFSHDDLTINGSGSLNIEALYKHGIDANDDLVITGGKISISAAEDGLHVNDAMDICDADICINAGDDAIHSDTEISVYSGTVLIESCYEGLEAPEILIEGGDITIYPTDDGLNANGGSNNPGFGMDFGMGNGNSRDFSETSSEGASEPGAGENRERSVNEAAPEAAAETESGLADEAEAQSEDEDEITPTITINGGTIRILNENGRDADGIDSNGDIFINGGTIYVNMVGSGGNNGLDYGSENGGSCYINGGNVIVTASSSMAEEISSDSAQCNVMFLLDEEAPAGSLLELKDAEGNVVMSEEVPYSFSSAVMSCAELTDGESYSIDILSDGETVQTAEFTFSGTALSVGDAGGGMGNMMQGFGGWQTGPSSDMTEGGFPGQMPEGMEMPSDSPMAEGGFPGQMPEGMEMPSDTSMTEGEFSQNTQGGGMEMPSDRPMTEGDFGQNKQDGGMGGGQGQPGGPMDQGQGSFEEETEQAASTLHSLSEYGNNVWLLLLAALVVLAAGILFVRKW